MKKLLRILWIMLLAVILTACGKEPDYQPPVETSTPTPTPEPVLQEQSFLPTEEFVRTHPTGYAHQLREQLPELAKYPQLFAPGTETEYANINMLLCALIIENISGVSYPQYMKNEVFDPLGMKTAVSRRPPSRCTSTVWIRML